MKLVNGIIAIAIGDSLLAQGGESRGLLAGSAVSVSVNASSSPPACDEAIYEYPNFDLQNSSFTLAYQSDQYTLVPGAGSWISPTGGQNFGDDTEANITLPFGLPYPGGVTTTLRVCSNGFVTTGSSPAVNNYTPTVAKFLPLEMWCALWRDFNPANGGDVFVDSSSQRTVVSWSGVPNYPNVGSNTFQMQFWANGDVHVIYQNITVSGSYLVGFSVDNASDPGSVDISDLLNSGVTACVGSGGTLDGTTLIHPNGFAQTAPLQFPGTLESPPDLRFILSLHGAPAALHCDDYSTGVDDILVDENGVLEVPTHLWSVWSFSVRQGAVGSAGSAVAREALIGNVGSALFSYVLPGSGLPAEVVGVVERSHSGNDLGLPGASADIDGIDQQLMFGLDQGLGNNGINVLQEPGFLAFQHAPPTILFTVSDATKALVPTSWWQGSAPSGATIFSTEISASSGLWSPPQTFMTYADLGLGVAEDIDALAVDIVEEKLLFSVTGNARDQFLFLGFGADGNQPVPVVKTNGVPISQSVGIDADDDVDAVCTLDPNLEAANTPQTGGDGFGSTCGAPRDGILGPVPEMSGSAYRRYEGGQIRFDTFMVGWPSTSGPTPSLAVAFLTTYNNIDPILIGGVHVRDPNNPIPGDPQAASFVVPANLALQNFPVTLRWFNLGWFTGQLDEAWPVQVFL